MTFSPGDKVRLVHDGRALDAVLVDPVVGFFAKVEGSIGLSASDLAALGFAVEPVPLAEPPVGSRVRVRWEPVASGDPAEAVYERIYESSGYWNQVDGTRLTGWSDLAPHVVSVGVPTYEWTEVTR